MKGWIAPAVAWMVCGAVPCMAADVEVSSLRCEYLQDPLGIDVAHPRLSWVLKSQARGQKQIAYRILVASTAERLGRNEADLWDSGRCAVGPRVLVPYAGKTLLPRSRYFWKVMVWERNGAPSKWSKPAQWSTGLALGDLYAEELEAQWIGAAQERAFEENPWLRKSFELAENPERAMAYVASIGYHELYVNGKKVGDRVLVPATSDLSKRVRYVTYDITPFLRKGRNTVAFWLGSGWGNWEFYHVANKPLVLSEVDVVLPDGDRLEFDTDATWKIHPSSSTLLARWKPGNYGGERVDCNKLLPDWNRAGFDDSSWPSAAVYAPDLMLSAKMIEPNRRVATLDPVSIDEVLPQVYRIDMGRSFTGWTEIALRGESGATVRMRFSERADEEMSFGQESECILDEKGRGVFCNRFNYSAGRWITLYGLGEMPALGDIKGYLVRSDYGRTGSFSCSNPLLNKIYDTVLWTFESLSLGGYVVDCPHRERMGYGGDAHATMETALSNYALGAFFTKWIEDWRDVQKADGDVPYTAPTHWGGGGPAWSGVCITLPWAVYERYADRRILEETYPTMQRWIDFLHSKSSQHMLVKWGGEWDFLGDWVPPGKDQGKKRVDERSTLFFNNCYYLYNVETIAKIADLLGNPQEASIYRRQAKAIRAAVHREFFHPKTNTYANGNQLYMALPLFVGLPPQKLRPAIMKALEKEIVEAKGGHIDTGIHGTYFLLKMLTAADRNDLVYTMVSKTDYPSWGAMLEQGATTIWEEWGGENSHLHSSFLSVGAWFIEGLAGIQPDERNPGYKHFTIKPGVVGDLRWVKAGLDTLYGRISSDWQIENRTLVLDVVVPPGTTATVWVPARQAAGVVASAGAEFLRLENNRALFAVESGHYRFVSDDFLRMK